MTGKHRLVELLGFPATLIHGDTTTLDRWRWLVKRLPVTRNSETVVDVGCGAGGFSIGLALRGYQVTGISWDQVNNDAASRRAELCGAQSAKFIIGDVKDLDKLPGLETQYDLAICLECIEHLVEDGQLLRKISDKLKPGGRLLLTTPNYYAPGIDQNDLGPFIVGDHGWHVRRGYTPVMLRELCEHAGLVLDEVSWCTGPFSRFTSRLWRLLVSKCRNQSLAWLLFLPVRLAAFLLLPLDQWRVARSRFDGTSICLEAAKPRFAD